MISLWFGPDLPAGLDRFPGAAELVSRRAGLIEDKEGRFAWAAPDDEVHAFINDLERPIGSYLYGRRMYETMGFWETSSTEAAVFRDYADIWRAAEKIVFLGLVDECRLFLCPIVVGGGKRTLPDGVRAQLELLDERRFRNGVVPPPPPRQRLTEPTTRRHGWHTTEV